MNQAVLDARTARVLPWLVAIAFFMQTLDGTILNTALPAMARDLAEDPLRMQGVVIAYMLTVALLIPASGWVADRFGSRRIFFSAILLFTLGSLLCAMSTSFNQLVMSRVVQAIGGALMLPVGRLVILRAYPRSEFVRVMTFIALPGMVGPLIGPTLGGWLVEYASWHWIFLINLPVGLIGCIAAFRFMPDLKSAERMRFDTVGFLLFGGAMVLITIALEGLGEMQMPHARVLLLVAVGSACLAAYWLRAGHIDSPLFSPTLFHTRSFAVGIFGNLFARLGSGALPFLLPLLLQIALGYSPAQAGMSMIPLALGAMFIKPLAKPLIDRLGYRRILIGNTLLLGTLIASLATIDGQTPTVLLLAQLSLIGMVNSMQFTAMNTVTLVGLSNQNASSGNSLLSVVVQLSMSLGVASAGALLGGFTVPGANGAAVLEAFHLTFLCIGAMSMLAASLFFQLDSKQAMVARHIDTE
ncbi:multidrug transporter subunit MdtD [Stutzerimonas xanthomarina]|uniref:Drug resistance transporter, EmrB/QacA subfamily n=2 Tax=Stutzerimonas xanthomarina TaxID=271420 RepID=A0A1M5QN08_9GAMM|nr:multidrug transporter subunit MdtD [Stutzerimonas xanthomarina]MCP9338489.1 multidrug transporter subunit MdtD [Stutzerimonas xanthomarina]SEH67889.1 drug resistance transporter, EmrB/QacA subfamily [Stutzerimonas xanthomarina]SHH15386.1 drug resistance transporter, EmrB/QacA subfamily [Stutzerimonas xanthomarina DSM 18231]